MKIKSYAFGKWVEGDGTGQDVFNAITGEKIGEVTSRGLDFRAMLDYARNIGGPKLRKMTFHERARMLKALATFLMSKKDVFYPLSYATGATKNDSWLDIEGGIGTLFTYASKGRRELPDLPFYIDGNVENLSKNGTFIGHHIAVPLEGVAIHINAFNFPCWGMLEKLSPTLLAGVPAIIKPASITCYLTELMVKEIIDSNILPEGALQLVCGSAGDMLNYTDSQDVVTFTGSASTGKKLKQTPAFIENSVRFNMEADSLNFSILAPDASPDSPEFDFFIKEVVREMTVKAGQKCTAIRRAIVPENMIDNVVNSLKGRLSKTIVGNPLSEGVKMGALAGKSQVEEVSERVKELLEDCELVYGNPDEFTVVDADKSFGAFFPPTVLFCNSPFEKRKAHDIEAFGPVTTLMPYKNIDEAIELAKMGRGSLVGSIFTGNDVYAKELILGTASYHGRIMVVNRNCAAESTGHGSPLPHLVHGGPGRAGGGEELGGIRGVLHFMQRTAIQGSPTTLSYLIESYIPGAKQTSDLVHPFHKYFDDLQIGETLITHKRTITETDIVNFTGISWDNFYAHTDVTSLEGTIFEQRVAHGYFIISAAAGLFVGQGKCPVLANYGIDELRFTKPVYAGDTIYVKLTVKEKTVKETKADEQAQGVVKWYVEVFNQKEETVAILTILTLVARK